LPDEERTWSLDGREIKKKGEKQLTVRVCPKCFGAQPSGKGICQHCGHKFDVKERVLNEVDGELQEIDKSKLKVVRKDEQSKARTLQQLEELGRSRGYKRAALWARHVYMSRQRRG
jgi:DNA-directed RNA polymerase subunit RPC12/RpoP